MGARRLVLVVAASLCALGGGAVFSGVALASSAAPQIERVWAASVGVTGATLHATITPDPETLPETASDTVYRFEYGTGASYGSSVPLPDAAIAASTSGVDVSQSLGGLQPDTTYHYRVVAVNPSGESAGSDRVFTTFPLSSGGDSCPNSTIRGSQFSSYLPDCRAYELASPPYDEKEGANVSTTPFQTQSSLDGNAIKFFSRGGFGDVLGSESLGGAEYIAQRASEGWVTHSINPEQGSRRTEVRAFSFYQAASPDLSKGVFTAFTPVVPGHPNVEHITNLYVRNDLLTSGLGDYELLNDAASPVAPSIRESYTSPAEIWFAAASSDWTHVLFESNHNLTPEAAGLDSRRPKAYEWDKGTVRLVGILPDGSPAEASLPGRGVATPKGAPIREVGEYELAEVNGSLATHAISADGSRVVFTGPQLTYGGSGVNGLAMAGNLYMRIDHKTTIQLNVSERTEGLDPNGPQPAMFTAASSDDSKVFLVTTQALTDDATVNSGSEKLYMYDSSLPEGHRLTLISPPVSPEGGVVEASADLDGAVVGMDENGDYVYFLSGARLYVLHDGAVHYVVSHQGPVDWNTFYLWGTYPLIDGDTFRTSPDGKTIVFMSADRGTAQRTGYENVDPTGTCGRTQLSAGRDPYCYEVYTYNVDRDELQCASCGSSDAPAIGDASFVDLSNSPRLATQYLNRPMSSDGHYVFFDTREALVPQDTNGQTDVYEYDTVSRRQHLLSSGACDCNSYFSDASQNGRDAFFTTSQRLLYADIDTSVDLYDVRIEGGIPAQNRPPAAVCAGEECQGPVPSAPVFSLPASSTFAGIGNQPVSASKPAVKRVKHKATHRKQHRRKGKHRGKKSNRHASRRSGR